MNAAPFLMTVTKSPAPLRPRPIDEIEWMEFMVRATDLLSSTLDYDKALEQVAALAVPWFADWAAVDLLEDGILRQVAFAYHDPRRLDEARRLREKYPADPDAAVGPYAVLRTGERQLMANVTPEQLAAGARTPEHADFLLRSGISSLLMVPLPTQPKSIGVLTFVRGAARPPFTQRDADRAQELAVRAALPVEHGRRFAEPRDTNEPRSDTVDGATDQRRDHDAKARLAAIVDSSSDAIIAKDLDGIIQSWNEAASRAFGYTAQEVIGKPITILIPENLKEEARRILDAIRHGEPVQHYETKRLRKDGSLIDISLSVSPIRDRSGRVVGASKIARDITEGKRIQQELEKLNVELEQRVQRRTAELETAVRELEAFNYTVSHDLRTPLRTIGGFAKLVAKDAALPADLKDYVAHVLDASGEMTRITEGLLRLSRIRPADVQRSEVDLTALANQVAKRLRHDRSGREVEVHVQPDLTASGDPALVEVVLENLLGNAWKFTSQVARAHVTVGERVHNGQRMFFVEDNGIGFSEADARNLFVPFQRLRPLEFEGSGIGLATVRRIVQVHGGIVEADGEPGKRATIYFTL